MYELLSVSSQKIGCTIYKKFMDYYKNCAHIIQNVHEHGDFCNSMTYRLSIIFKMFNFGYMFLF